MLGCNVVEIDLRRTLDGEIVLNHDGILERLSDGVRQPASLAMLTTLQQDGSGSIAFHVSGTTSDPQTDLPTRLLLQNTQIKNVINKALNKFFR